VSTPPIELLAEIVKAHQAGLTILVAWTLAHARPAERVALRRHAVGNFIRLEGGDPRTAPRRLHQTLCRLAQVHPEVQTIDVRGPRGWALVILMLSNWRAPDRSTLHYDLKAPVPVARPPVTAAPRERHPWASWLD
jgi:hypothetical protein